METPEHQDPAWQLLLKARRVEPSPFFARDVLREVRQLAEQRSDWYSFWQGLFRRPLLLASGGVAAAVVLAVACWPENPAIPVATVVPPALPEAELAMAEEVHSVEYLGALMAIADPSQLDDQALADLLY